MPRITVVRWIRRNIRNQEGSVSVIAAVAMVALVGSAALSIDVGTLFNAKRKQQAATDIAAIVAAGHISSAAQAVADVLSDNGIKDSAQASIEYGTYVADPSLTPEKRFRVVDQSAADSLRISVTDTAPLYFGSALAALSSAVKDSPSGVTIRTQATASAADFAAFAVGSRLASLNGGIANAILSKLLGVQVSLSLMDYQALATAQVDLFQVSRALATYMNVSGVTYGQVTSGSARVGDVLTAVLASERVGGGGADAALNQLVQAETGSTDTISLTSLVDFGPFAPAQVGAEAPMAFRPSALDMVMAVAQIAGRGHVIAIDLTAVVPGLTDVRLLLSMGAPPSGSSYFQVGRTGAQVQTAQARLLLSARVTALPPLLSLTLPVYVELASAKATLNSLACSPGPDTPAVTLGVQPSLVDTWVGSVSTADLSDFVNAPRITPGPVATVLGLAAINGSAHVPLTNVAPSQLRFTSLDIANGTKRSTSTTDVSAGIAQGLAANLRLTVGPVGGIAVPALASQAIAKGIGGAAPVLDAALDSVLSTLGLRVGEADAWVNGVRCGGGVLVN